MFRSCFLNGIKNNVIKRDKNISIVPVNKRDRIYSNDSVTLKK